MEMLRITIDLENEAFQGGQSGFEIARILRGIAFLAEVGIPDYPYPIRDSNENNVGTITIVT